MNDNSDNVLEMAARGGTRTQETREKAFASWRNNALVHSVVALLAPPSDKDKETMEVLLHSAFDAGFSTGSKDVMLDVIEMTLKSAMRDKNRRAHGLAAEMGQERRAMETENQKAEQQQ